MPEKTNPYPELLDELRAFVKARDWSQFHSPKNLAMALTAEVGELVEPFQWLSGDESDTLDSATRAEVRRELADVQIYLMLLADRLDIDLMDAAGAKIEENAGKYPIDRARGRSSKYNEL
ncbi:nucleotide pyrophosphohydrolase [Arhodomonas sp. SL1]|uniref:nucleotide pyrophosphohydrolase n=1 Tax=Arhodomonas sp. SL1 TaxID=3425691 RepID=UPI003F882A03